MEHINPLEKLTTLEKKISQLVDMVKMARQENVRLLEEKSQLISRLDMLETSLMKGTQSIEELTQERSLTKEMVDELISSIDRIVEQEQK